MNSKDDEKRIDELIAELSACREDERNTQNEILQVISIAGAVIGILLGISYFDSKQADLHFISPRAMFFFSIMIFCTAFSYVLVLGIYNILRYYYIQSLEDRLHVLISDTSDDKEKGPFLHWNAFIAPIITRNPRHITSGYTALAFTCYSVAAIGVAAFSAAMVVALYMQITPKSVFDQIVVGIFVFIALLVISLFFIVSNHAKEMSQFAWDTACENQKERRTGNGLNQYQKSTSFRRMLFYLIYPKRQDLQKPCLIILGFIYGLIYMGNMPNPLSLYKLVFALIIFDFLAYQARYQINDIRGIEEDQEAGKTDRLPIDACKTPGDAIKISLTVAIIKIIIAIAITAIWGGEMRTLLIVSLVILAVLTICYEIFRAMGWTKAIFFWVGTGYPLRFFVGFFLLVPWQSISLKLAIIVLALWTYGSFAAILPWTDEVTKRMEETEKNSKNKCSLPSYKKKHFGDIQTYIIQRYNSAKSHPVNDKVMPLREKGMWNDPWYICMIFCMFLFLVSVFAETKSFILLIMEGIILVAFAASNAFEQQKKVLMMCLGWIGIIANAVLGIYFTASVWYLALLGLQMIVTVTYFILYYQPQIKKTNQK